MLIFLMEIQRWENGTNAMAARDISEILRQYTRAEINNRYEINKISNFRIIHPSTRI